MIQPEPSQPHIFFITFKWTKKGESECCGHLLSPYGCFLSISTIIAAPIMIITIAITATPNSRLAVDARPVGGAAVGAGVGGGLLA